VSEHYIGRVGRFASRLFQECRSRLARGEITIETNWDGKHSTRIIIVVENNPGGHWVCDEALTEIVDALNARFASDRHYDGIELDVPCDWADGYEDHFEHPDSGRLRVKRSNHG
jgi:hypothetical protein